MKVALLMNDNNYCGREYAKALAEKSIEVDVITIGEYPEKNETEDERCGYLWNPPLLKETTESDHIFNFETLKSDELVRFLKEKRYDVGIQGGTGIITRSIINEFKYGILNFHPGDLPKYRGCSAPEWQMWEGNEIVCTCHIVDEKIDAGEIFRKKVLDVPKDNYFKMRSQIYVEISKFVCEVIGTLDENFLEQCQEQDESLANYRKYIGDEKIELLIERMNNQKDD